jgi:hypothetical protein
MKKPKTMVDLLAVVDVCIEDSEAQARLHESRGKGPSKRKQDDWEVNTTDRETTGIPGTVRIAEIVETTNIMGITSNNPQIRRRRDRSIALSMQRSGAKFIVPQDTI